MFNLLILKLKLKPIPDKATNKDYVEYRAHKASREWWSTSWVVSWVDKS